MAPVASFGWFFCSLLGVLSCNSLLGVGEASLRCDTDPCTTDVASAGSSAGGAGSAESDAGAVGSGAGGVNGVGASAAGGSEATINVSGPVSSSEPSNGSASGDGPGPAPSGPTGEAGAASSGPVADSGAPAVPALCSSGGDACGTCLCDTCEDEVTACAATPGCFEIVACARVAGCEGFACFCGSVNAFTCATNGGANGPCVEATLAAPGSHLPTLASPSAGPASDAALALGNCSRQSCFAACQD